MKKLLDDISKLQVAVIGDVILDHFAWGRVSRISQEAPVPVVDIDRDVWSAGGAANVAMNIAALKANATLYGSSADDASGEILSELLLNAQIYYDKSLPSDNAPTAMKTRVASKGQQLMRLDRAGKPGQYEPSITYVKNMLKNLDKADLVIISDYARGFLGDALISSVIESARASGTFVAVDPKPRRLLNFCGANLMTANREEAFVLAGIPDDNESELPIDRLAKNIYEKYSSDHLVITLGEAGMYVCKKGKPMRHIPSAAKEVFDTSGAGDVVISCLSLALAAGADIDRAADFASQAAGIVVGKTGSTVVSADELSKRKL